MLIECNVNYVVAFKRLIMLLLVREGGRGREDDVLELCERGQQGAVPLKLLYMCELLTNQLCQCCSNCN